MKHSNINLKSVIMILYCIVCFGLSGCGNGGNSKNNLEINISGYTLNYNGYVELGKVALRTDDLDEIIDLYQEVGDDVGYRDSLLVAKKSSQGLGINAFAQNNLDTLEKQGLTLSDIKKTQIKLGKESENINAVLVEYKITEGLIEGIPVLYMSQLFVPDRYDVKLISFITEDSTSSSYAVDMFKNIN